MTGKRVDDKIFKSLVFMHGAPWSMIKAPYSFLFTKTTISATSGISPLFWVLTTTLLFAFLGSREIWTQEWRWGEIVRCMLLYQDYFHPWLAGKLYFDKPLLSYWLMASIAQAIGLSTFAIRLPSAIAGIISLACIYQIGKKWLSASTGALAAIMLVTTYYFVFWARTASTDALNLAGILGAVAWYFSKRDQPNFANYAIFFTILAVTALLKGPIGFCIALLAIAPDVVPSYKERLNWQLLPALIPPILLYILPFWLTSVFNHTSLSDSGLYDVYRENILRFFEPFDHKDPFYTYFIYLPIYLLPWTLFFFPALYDALKRWQQLEPSTRQLILTNALIFLFLTVSGSRRSYYILPLVPFSLLLTAQWMQYSLTSVLVKKTITLSFLGLFGWFIIIQPFYYSDGGLALFGKQLNSMMRQNADKNWQIVFLDADNRLSFYLPNNAIAFLNNRKNKKDFKDSFDNKTYRLLITQEAQVQYLKAWGQPILKARPHRGNRFLCALVPDAPVAFITHSV